MIAALREAVSANEALIGFTIRTRSRHLLDAMYDVDDAWQDGWLGLVRAVERWDPDRGALATIAVPLIAEAVLVGRGHLEGVTWRRQQKASHRHERRLRLVSLDAELNHDRDGLTLVDLLPDTGEDPADAAVGNVTVATVVAAGRSACLDDIDRDVLGWLTDPFDTRRPGDLAAAAGRTTQAMRLRRIRLADALRPALEAAA